MILLFENFNTIVNLIQIVWEKYNPVLHSGDFPELTKEERNTIKKILTLKGQELSYADISTKINTTEDQLKNMIKVFDDDLLRRSLPQGNLQG